MHIKTCILLLAYVVVSKTSFLSTTQCQNGISSNGTLIPRITFPSNGAVDELVADDQLFDIDNVSHCPVPLRTDYSVERTSPCVWRTLIDNDTNRIPVSIPYAKCHCRTCRTYGSDFTCRPVKRTMMVVKNISTDQFETQYIDVPIACTCVKNLMLS
ncbi:uncharacterized protein LOC117117918 isoform X2 [Anneissia japonica]|nr:uncharacterized protein LOC117117918 isoform X2 [Anneissia japonica]